MKTKIISYIIVIFFTGKLLAYNNLTIVNPQEWWNNGIGKIDKVDLTITSKGLFFRYDLEMTISSLYPENFFDSDQLEIQYYFDLPENATIIESFLWVGDTLVRGKLFDKWTANAIYESIVNRRRDPSVLYKIGTNNYELHVYPMKNNESRTFIISYYLPADLDQQNTVARLSTDMFDVSGTNISNFNITIKNTENIGEPFILKNNSEKYKLSNTGKKWEKNFSYKLGDNLSVYINSPLKNGMFLSTYKDGDDGYYQLGFLPSRFLSGKESAKVLIVVDIDAEKMTFNKSSLCDIIKTAIQNNLCSTDSFNIIFSSLNPHYVCKKWIPADSVSIELAFQSVNTDDIADYSLLPTTLANGIGYINNAKIGEILVITSSNKEGNYKDANLLIDDLLSIIPKPPVIHTVNISNFNTSYYYQGGINYPGDEYFLSVLARRTGGNYFSIRNNNTKDINILLSEALNNLKGVIQNADLYTDCKNGFCYSKYFINDFENNVSLNEPVIQFGRYIGESPFNFIFSGIIDGEPFSSKNEIKSDEIMESNIELVQLLAGLKIKNLESISDYSNETINEIIYESLSNHVLSSYTAFLALEPGMDPDAIVEEIDDIPIIDEGNVWEFPVVSIDDIDHKDLVLSIYPNPFVDNIVIDLSEFDLSLQNTDLRIVNLMGQTIKIFNLHYFNDVINWNGTTDDGNEIEKGIYFVILRNGINIYKSKIIKK